MAEVTKTLPLPLGGGATDPSQLTITLVRVTSLPWQLSGRLIHLRSGWASGEESLTRVLERGAEYGLGLRPRARLDKGLLPTGPAHGGPTRHHCNPCWRGGDP